MTNGSNPMFLITFLKRIKSFIWNSSLFKYFDNQKNIGLGTIYMLHRCDNFDFSKLTPNENLKIPPDKLEEFLLNLQKESDIISLDELYDRLQSGLKSKKQFSVITFDDGYKDNLYNALPVFEKLQVPFAVYVTDSFPECTANLWWFVIEDLICSHDILETSDGYIYSCLTPEEKSKTFYALRRKILSIKSDSFAEEFAALFNKYPISMEKTVRAVGLTWDEVKQLDKSNYCTIGCHTYNHLNLASLSDEKMMDEIATSQNHIEEILGHPVYHFAYPYGSKNEVSSRVIKNTSSFNFKTAVLSYGGAVKTVSLKNKMKLPRRMFGLL